jgi:hypothetical protein
VSSNKLGTGFVTSKGTENTTEGVFAVQFIVLEARSAGSTGVTILPHKKKKNSILKLPTKE